MNIWIEVAGYIASALVAASFYMKTIIPLRIFAITSNIAFITYGIGAGLYPVIILHTFLFPLNILRLLQMKKLINNVKDASEENFSLQSLIPYMTIENLKKGDIIFKKGDIAEKMYYLCSGRVELEGYGIIPGKGNLLGEMGIFSPFNERTDTAKCIDEDMKIYSITEKGVKQLYYQNPEFGFYLIKMITRRFITGLENIKKKYRYYPAIIVIVSLFLFSCYSENKKLQGQWESIHIENNSSLFAKTLPSSDKGEVILTLEETGEFSWINKSEKTDLSGKYYTSRDEIFLDITGDRNRLVVKFKLKENNLIIITDDEFIFTFIKKVKTPK